MSSGTTFSFDASDSIGWQKFAENLEAYLKVDSALTNGGLVVSIEGRFGSGKTHFLKMWESHLLEKYKSSTSGMFYPVYVNVWTEDFHNDAVVTVLCTLVEAIRSMRTSDESPDSGQVASSVKRWTKIGIGLIEQYVRHKTGISAREVLELADLQADVEHGGVFASLQALSQTLKEIRELLKSVTENQKVVFLIDELDRCRPSFAVSYLEAFAHVFDISGLIVVLGIDQAQLASSAKSMFGGELDTEEYLRKFIRRRFNLPLPNAQQAEKLAKFFWDKLVKIEGVRDSFLSWESARHSIVIAVSLLQMTPRQMESAFSILGHIFIRNDPLMRLENDHVFPLYAVLACLKVSAPAIYRSLSMDRFALDQLYLLLRHKNFRDRSDLLAICAAAMPNDQMQAMFVTISDTRIDVSSQWNKNLFSLIRSRIGEVDSDRIYHVYRFIESADTLDK